MPPSDGAEILDTARRIGVAPHLECKRLDGRGNAKLREQREAWAVKGALIRPLPRTLAKHTRQFAANHRLRTKRNAVGLPVGRIIGTCPNYEDLASHSGAWLGLSNTADQLRGPRRLLAIADLVSCIRLFCGTPILIA